MKPEPSPAEPLLIEMSNAAVSRHGNEIPLVTGITWQVKTGDYWVVCGLHGSGKTSFLTTAAGLQRPLQGRHLLFGQDTAVLGDDELVAERLRVGLVFENGGRLFSHLTVAENVALPLRYHGDCAEAEAEAKAEAWLDFLGLTPYAQQTPERISRFWRQRAALARALVLEPELLLFDNPVSGMDPRQANWWFEVLRQLADGISLLSGRKITLVVAVGDLQPWLEQGRQFALLHQKQWRLLGAREEMAGQVEPLMRELLAAESAM